MEEACVGKVARCDGWSVSNSLESLFCMDALDEAVSAAKPIVFHSDQVSQYTCSDFVDELKDRKIKVSISD